MGTIRRASRRRLDDHDRLMRAWDAGDPPPPEARDPERRDDLIGLVFFAWCERTPEWTGDRHPHASEWLAALH